MTFKRILMEFGQVTLNLKCIGNIGDTRNVFSIPRQYTMLTSLDKRYIYDLKHNSDAYTLFFFSIIYFLGEFLGHKKDNQKQQV